MAERIYYEYKGPYSEVLAVMSMMSDLYRAGVTVPEIPTRIVEQSEKKPQRENVKNSLSDLQRLQQLSQLH